MAMASLSWPRPTVAAHVTPHIHLQRSELLHLPRLSKVCTVPCIRLKHLRLPCTNLPPWEEASALTYTPENGNDIITKVTSIFEPLSRQDPDEASVSDTEDNITDVQSQTSMLFQPLKWPMWLLGPSVLLVTGIVPTLWLPLSSVFLGTNIASLLSLVGLDCIFNMGATLFLLMADACARSKSPTQSCKYQVPFRYKFWNMAASVMGFLVPLVMLLASHKGFSQPQLPFISFAVLLGPYLLLLAIQTLTEVLTWHWKSSVWLVTPVVYEAYRVLQLMRGLRLGGEIGAPSWVVESIRGLVSWWILILGMQLMWVAWYAGFTAQTRQGEA